MNIQLKTDPKYGVYPWWPEDGDDWLHPDDVAIARSIIPSQRVFRRDGTEGEYVLLHYGEVRLRVRRTLWQEVRTEGYDLGDWVEIKSRVHQNTPRTGPIREILFNPHENRLEYLISQNELPIETRYLVEDFRPVEKTQENTWTSEIRNRRRKGKRDT